MSASFYSESFLLLLQRRKVKLAVSSPRMLTRTRAWQWKSNTPEVGSITFTHLTAIFPRPVLLPFFYCLFCEMHLAKKAYLCVPLKRCVAAEVFISCGVLCLFCSLFFFLYFFLILIWWCVCGSSIKDAKLCNLSVTTSDSQQEACAYLHLKSISQQAFQVYVTFHFFLNLATSSRFFYLF